MSTTEFRCRALSAQRGEAPAGTASRVTAFLLLEEPGPWGRKALRDARLPEGVGARLTARADAAGVKVLLMRAPGRRLKGAGRRIFAGYVDPAAPWLETAELDAVDDVLDLDLDALGAGRRMGLAARGEPVFAVCTHGQRDLCCAELGRPTAAALAAAHPDLTWEVSHLGGHRFAANLLVLPHGLLYGRLDPVTATQLATEHLAGHLSLDHLRGRSGLPAPLQAAEVALRRHLAVTDLDAVGVVGHETVDEETTAVLEVRGAHFRVRVRSGQSPEAQLVSCSDAVPETVTRHDVLDIREVGH